MDPVLCLEHEIRRAQINKVCAVAVFFNMEKANDMMWREGLLIKIHKLGVRGWMYRWILDCFKGYANTSENWKVLGFLGL